MRPPTLWMRVYIDPLLQAIMNRARRYPKGFADMQPIEQHMVTHPVGRDGISVHPSDALLTRYEFLMR